VCVFTSSRPFLVSIWLVSHYSLHQYCSLVSGNDKRHLLEIKATKRGKMQGFESLRAKYVGPVGKFINGGGARRLPLDLLFVVRHRHVTPSKIMLQ
jgi:hypothetical protein